MKNLTPHGGEFVEPLVPLSIFMEKGTGGKAREFVGVKVS